MERTVPFIHPMVAAQITSRLSPHISLNQGHPPTSRDRLEGTLRPVKRSPRLLP